jgi:CHRD domain
LPQPAVLAYASGCDSRYTLEFLNIQKSRELIRIRFLIAVQFGMFFSSQAWGLPFELAHARTFFHVRDIMKTLTFAATMVASIALSQLAIGAIVLFDLQGVGGAGLLASNEVTATGLPANILGTPGIGGESGAGFFFDDVANVLTLNASWTGLQGATIGTFGAATGFHIHGPVTAANPFLGTASVLHNISNGTAGGGAIPNYVVSNLANGSGSLAGTLTNLPSGQIADLLAGKWYVNIHSGVNGGGEIRGNLVAVVPEPTSLAFIVASGMATLVLRRRR